MNNSNQNMIFVKPKNGIQLTIPETGEKLCAKGALVAKNAFWHRRLRDGDVVETNPAHAEKKVNEGK